ncbi:MAG TPA: ABC transporter permease [Longimicrobiaceae bacterium]|nr:ABC transporter permease [Longimicrobiaceae bacterium]
MTHDVEPGAAAGAEGVAQALRHDVRFALRWLGRSPAFTAAVVLTLALAIGVNTVMFSVVNAVLLRPLPFPDPGRLVSVWPQKALGRGAFQQFRDGGRGTARVAGFSDATGFGVAGGGEPERVEGAWVSGDLMGTLGVAAARGRAFTPADESPGAAPVVLLSDGLWRQRYGADPGIVGRRVVVEGIPRTVAGVMPPDFRFPSRQVRMWLPVRMDASDPAEFWGGEPALHMVGRLAPGVTPGAADAAVRALAPRVAAAAPWPLPATWSEGAGAAPLRTLLLGDVATPLLLLLGAVGLVLLIACGNVANLLLARNAARTREIATRAALGAPRARLVRQLATESLLLYLAGGAAGLLLALAAGPVLMAALPADTPRAAEIGVDGRVLAFTLALTLATGLAFGVLPALRASRADLQSSLKEGSKATAGAGNRRVSALLAAGEVALAVTLAIGAGLLVRSLAGLLRVDTGFQAERVVTARVSPPAAAYGDDGRVLGFYNAVLEGVGHVPGVQSAALVHRIPLGGEASALPLQVEGQPVVPGAAAPTAGEWRVTPEYLGVMGVPLLRGRAFTAADRDGAPAVALVNRAMARRFWPGADPVGKRIRPVWWREWVTVVGVVGDVKEDDLTGDAPLQVYRPFAQGPVAEMHLVVRTRADPAALAPALRRAVAGVDPAVPVSEVRTMAQVVVSSLARPRFTVLLLSVFAALAVLLGGIGIYGVIAQGVSQRVQEFGIRMALGATPAAVLGGVLRQGLRLAVAGVLAGVVAAALATRLFVRLLYGVGPLDPLTFVLAAAFMVAVALVAAYFPARRATRVDPVLALRAE